jgi:hypothetical protein
LLQVKQTKERRMRLGVLPVAILTAAVALGPSHSLSQEQEQVESEGGSSGGLFDRSKAKPVPQKLIAEIDFENVSLSEVIAHLRKVDPTFQAVVSYLPGAEVGGPRIQELRLKNVPVESILGALTQAYPQIHLDLVPGSGRAGDSRVWTIRVEAGQKTREDTSSRTYTSVHRLREIIDELIRRPGAEGDRKKALESIMSLMQSIVDIQGKGGDPHAKVMLHEATETLIFNGTERQTEQVHIALNALATQDEKVRNAYKQTEEFQRERDVVSAKLRATADELSRVSKELAAAKVQVAELEAIRAKLKAQPAASEAK